METVHSLTSNPTSIKKYSSHETHVAAIMQALIGEQNVLLFLKQLSLLGDFMFIKERLGQMQKLVTRKKLKSRAISSP